MKSAREPKKICRIYASTCSIKTNNMRVTGRRENKYNNTYNIKYSDRKRTDAVSRGVDDIVHTAGNPIITILIALGTVASEIVAYVCRMRGRVRL